MADLQTDEESERKYDRCVCAFGVVGWRREDQVAVSHQGAGVADEHGADGEDGANETFIYKGIDAAVLDEGCNVC